MTPPLPVSVKIGYRRFTIVDWNVRAAVGADRLGECDHSCSTIRVCTIYGWVKAANTLLHEIMHAVWVSQALSDDDHEERYVLAISNGLSAMMVDSPDVMAWITEGLGSEQH